MEEHVGRIFRNKSSVHHYRSKTIFNSELIQLLAKEVTKKRIFDIEKSKYRIEQLSLILLI